ncbi:protein JASON-like [Syzygium oleosum]|uniref:protein JASON-like n=1 Tax=Syzygium oleosum TaxID=219896 RepID=UPI0011D2282C|nr:protein JASON-like [Syzygium oleosum]
MICALLNRELGLAFRSFLGFLDRSLGFAMGCFFVCLRARDGGGGGGRRHLPQTARPRKAAEALASRNRLSSLFLAEDREDVRSEDLEDRSFGTPQISKDVKDEAKFLKACGTLPETPAEIRKATDTFMFSPPNREDSESSKFHSWLPHTSVRKLQLTKPTELSPTPVKLFVDSGSDSASQEHAPTSCKSNAESTFSIPLNSTEGSSEENVNMATEILAVENSSVLTPITTWPSASHTQNRNKSVHFDPGTDICSLRIDTSHGIKDSEFLGNQSTMKLSPYPTPLKLSDEMQTPGTVFPANMENLPYGKPRIRSEYIYSVPSSYQNNMQLKVFKDEDGHNHRPLGELNESLGQPVNETLNRGTWLDETCSEQGFKGETTLSAWLKPPLHLENDGSKFGSVSYRKTRLTRTPTDRPIIGLVAAHWKEEEQSHVSQKWWDGNGIPNSTNKYKEDQKVSWHATPFEERLEKALSEETFVSQRKNLSGAPIPLEDADGDTAISQLRSPAHTKPVASC